MCNLKSAPRQKPPTLMGRRARYVVVDTTDYIAVLLYKYILMLIFSICNSTSRGEIQEGLTAYNEVPLRP